MGAIERPIYLDYQSTTPVDQRVLTAMNPYFSDVFGNAASPHASFGEPARQAVERARQAVAGLLEVSPQEIVFTSGATESNNLAIKGVAANSPAGSHFVTCLTEHKSVLEVFQDLEIQGHSVTYLPVDREGRIDLNRLKDSLTDGTVLVSLMAANNEIGTVLPLDEVVTICSDAGVLFHTDAAQAVGKVPLYLGTSGVDLASLSAHKIYGPKGVGALFVRRHCQSRLRPGFHGGGQERGLRSGTANVPGCVGFGEACRILVDEGEAEAERLNHLVSLLEERLSKVIADVCVNGPIDGRLPGNLNVQIPGAPGDALVAALGTVAIATGSACTSDVPTSSHVLRAVGLSDEEAESSIRISVGRFTSEREIQEAVDLLGSAVASIRSLIGAAS